MQKLNKIKFVKTAILIFVLITVELVLGVIITRQAVSVLYDGTTKKYAEDTERVAAEFDGLIENGKTLSPDFNGSVSEVDLIIDGKRYKPAFNMGRTLKSNSVNVYSLKEICDNSSADEFILSDNKVYVIYGAEDGVGGVNLSFKNLDSLTEGFSAEGFDGIAIFSDSARAVYVKSSINPEGDEHFAAIKAIFDYSPNLTADKGTAQTVKSEGKTYALTITELKSARYYIGGYEDYSWFNEDTAKIRSTVGVGLSAIGVLTLALVFLGAYFMGDGVFGPFKTYRFLTDAEGRIIKANARFKTDFPDAETVRGNLSRFDEDKVYAVKLPARGEEKILACRTERFKGVISVKARELCLPFGEETETEKKSAMKLVYENFSPSRQVIAGRIYFSNLQEIKNVFGAEFAENVRNILLERIKRIFAYIFQFDYYNVGVILPDGKTFTGFLKEPAKHMSELSRVIKAGDNNVLIKVKSGFALSDKTMNDRKYEYVMTAADAALKRATDEKADDPAANDFYIFREAQKKAYSAYMRKMDIPQMLKNGDFYLEYQPQYSFKENRIVGFEALCRVNKKINIDADTADVIAYAERSGNMVALGNFIMSEGMKFAKSIENYGVSVSLNVSPVQLMQTGFAEAFLRIHRKYGLKPKSVAVEITESYLMQTVDETVKKLQGLHDNGVDIHLDDFGTQYSSFNYLKVLPISAIKIDRSFIKDIHKNRHSEYITRMIVDIADKLGYESICEGVETAEQLKVVRAQGCDVVQGFLIGKSVDETTAKNMIENYRYTENGAEKR